VPRYFRFYVKKRGSRRTDSRLLGHVAQLLFFAALFFVGLGFSGYLLATLIVPEWRANHSFLETKCVVLGKRLLERESAEPLPDDASNGKSWRPEFQIEYQAGRHLFQTRTYDVSRSFSMNREEAARVVDQFQVGQEYTCWYDPADPATAVLVRGYTWSGWVLLLLPLSLFVGGLGGLAITLLSWGKSAERKAVLAQRPIPLELFAGNGAMGELSTIPHHASLTDSPGTRLAYRLPLDARGVWGLVALLVAAAIVLAAASVFAVMTLASYFEGRPDVLMSAFVGGWLVLGAVGVAYSIQRLLKALRAGATIVEVSDHPIRPGRQYELFLLYRGRARLNRLTVSLACDEQATYRQGTNTRRDVRRVVNLPLGSLESVQSTRRQPLEARFPLAVPDGTMHSFRAVHNSIEWNLRVVGELESGGRFERAFPVVIVPAGAKV
jgi:hypothetical protein